MTCFGLPTASFDDDAAALRSIGIERRAVRDGVDRTFGAGTNDNALRRSGRHRRRHGHLPLTKPAKTVLELALREALAHKATGSAMSTIVLGILHGADKFTVGLITENVSTSVVSAAAALVAVGLTACGSGGRAKLDVGRELATATTPPECD